MTAAGIEVGIAASARSIASIRPSDVASLVKRGSRTSFLELPKKDSNGPPCALVGLTGQHIGVQPELADCGFCFLGTGKSDACHELCEMDLACFDLGKSGSFRHQRADFLDRLVFLAVSCRGRRSGRNVVQILFA